MITKNKLIIQDYSPTWAIVFQALKSAYQNHLKSFFIDIQHVGSTSVEGLAAKPVIDIDLIVTDNSKIEPVIDVLSTLGYLHVGDIGIKDREAFKRSSEEVPLDGSNKIWQKHHLYLCPADSVSLQNHLQFRDYLRQHPEVAAEYGALKKKLAADFPYDMDQYIAHKTPFITNILKKVGFSAENIEAITKQNK